MEFDQVITGRRAVREYTAQAVDERAIRNLIDAAVHAPSAVNQQPWTFTVVRDQSILDRISHDENSDARDDARKRPFRALPFSAQ